MRLKAPQFGVILPKLSTFCLAVVTGANMGDHRSRARVPLSQDVTTFAITVIDRVRDIAQAIIVSGDKNARPFCRNLRSALDGVKTQLQRPEQSGDEAQLEKVKTLLKNLERLCNVRTHLFCFTCLPENLPSCWGFKSLDLTSGFLTLSLVCAGIFCSPPSR